MKILLGTTTLVISMVCAPAEATPPPPAKVGENDTVVCVVDNEEWGEIALDSEAKRLRWTKAGVTNSVNANFEGWKVEWGDVISQFRLDRYTGGMFLNDEQIGMCVVTARELEDGGAIS